MLPLLAIMKVDAPEPSTQGLGRLTLVQPVDETEDSLVMLLTLTAFGSPIVLLTTLYEPNPEELDVEEVDDVDEVEDDEVDDEDVHHCALAVESTPIKNRHIVANTGIFHIVFLSIKNLPLSKFVLN